MLTQALTSAVRILLFRAGPQDFPFSDDPRLPRFCVAAALAADFALYALGAPPLPALIAALAVVATLAFYTRMLLRLRQLDNRAPQTVNALLLSGALLTTLMLYPMSTLQPMTQAIMHLVETNPELANDTAKLQALVAKTQQENGGTAMSAVLLMLVVWQFAVMSHIFRNALQIGLFGGIAVTLLCAFNLMVVQTVAGQFGAALGH